MAPLALFYDEAFLKYDFGSGHAFQNTRVKLAFELLRSCGVVDGAIHHVRPSPASEDDIRRVHERAYIDALKELSVRPKADAYEWGLGPGDNPIFPGMYDAAALQVGATVEACELVASGQGPRAYNLAGGLHHAMPAKASGFCLLNDVGVSVRRILEEGRVERVLYVDIDAHHGDGVQAIFYEDPRVLTISLHEDGRFLFPGTGFPEEVGRGKGRGYSVNVPLPPYTRDASYIHAFDAIVPPLARAFRPDLIFTQTGADAYYTDPLAHLKLTTRTYEHVARTVDGLSKELCGGRWVATTGGGYDLAACARVWALIASHMAGLPLPDETDPQWRELCRWETGAFPATVRDAPREGEPDGPSEKVRDVVASVKGHVFPLHGLPA